MERRRLIGIDFDPEVFAEIRRRKREQHVSPSGLVNRAVRLYFGWPEAIKAPAAGQKATK